MVEYDNSPSDIILASPHTRVHERLLCSKIYFANQIIVKDKRMFDLVWFHLKNNMNFDLKTAYDNT